MPAASTTRAAIGALVTLALGVTLMASLLLSAAPISSAMGMDAGPGAPVVVAEVSAATFEADAAADVAPAMPAACGTTCIADTTDVCSRAAGVTGTTLMALLLTTRRHTFLGLQARPRPSVLDGRPGWSETPWTVPSLSALSVLRV